MTNTEVWDRIAARIAAQAGPAGDVVGYGDGLPTERDLRLLGTIAGKRVLELGCGTGHNAVALVRQGAKAIAIEPSEQLAAHARRLAETHGVRIEVRVGDLADLAFLRAESVDLALSTSLVAGAVATGTSASGAFASPLGEADDLDRVLRQVHRVLKPNAAFVCTVPHPFALCLERESAGGAGPLPLGRQELIRSYLDEGPVAVAILDEQLTVQLRPVSTMFAAFARAGFVVDQLLELEPAISPDPGPRVPDTLLWRVRRLGL